MINYRMTVSGSKDLILIVIDSQIPLQNSHYQDILKKLMEVNLDEQGNKARPTEAQDGSDPGAGYAAPC